MKIVYRSKTFDTDSLPFIIDCEVDIERGDTVVNLFVDSSEVETIYEMIPAWVKEHSWVRKGSGLIVIEKKGGHPPVN